jgi:serine/threonine-protein kinase
MADKVAAGARVGRLGRYEVLNELGKGAMGVVYLAKDPVIGRLVAIKTIKNSQSGEDDSESREFRERFVREAQTAGILSHPNIVTIHDIGEDTDSHASFIAMEYIEGRNLKSLMTEKQKFSWDEIADLIAQIAEALDYAHRKGIIHRDIKPANIILTTDSKVKITDFGIAKVASSNLTTTGQFLGTPNYMSPEQVSGAPVDGRSDIFSLGVVLYELLTNRKPFQGDNLTAISYKIVHEDFTPPADLSPDIPPEFNPIVARAMAKDPWNRYQRGKDLALALYQLKAHMEEQKALQDLGTMVSAAENLPTLKLANLQELAAQGAPRERDTAVTPVAGSPAAVTPPPMPPPPPSIPTPSPLMPTPPPAASTPPYVAAPWPADSHDPELTAAVPPPAVEMEIPTSGSFENEDQLPPLPPQLTPSPAAGAGAPQEWKKLAKSEVNPKWFWRVVVGVGALAILIIGLFALFARSAAKPSVAPDAALEQEVRESKEALAEGQKLFGAGKYVESLAKFRQVLARSPNNQEARKYAQMAENAVKSQQEEQARATQVGELATAARTALTEGRPEEAKAKAEEALAIDASHGEAQAVLAEADAKIAEAKVAAEAAARKQRSARPTQVARKRDAAPTPAASTRVAGGAPAQGPAAAPASGNASVRLVFDSPINEGHVMVAVNDQILLRRPFSFKKNESHSVLGSFTVPSGSATIKAWLSGPGLPAAAFATTTAQISGGETRTLRLDYAGGKLAVQLQ